MAEQSEPTRFRGLFESALQAYEKKTGVILAQHPLAIRLQRCHSVESVTTVLLDQAQTFSQFRGGDRILTSIKNTLSILHTLSDTLTLGEATSLVCQKTPTSCFISLTNFYSHLHLRKQYALVSPSSLTYVPFSGNHLGILVTSK